MPRTFQSILLLILLMVAACRQMEPVPTATPSEERETEYIPRLEKRPCQTYNPTIGEQEGETFACGVMTVPQDRTQPDGEQIEIAYAILKSVSDSPRPDPMVLLSGGPGNSALYPDAFAEMAERFGDLRPERDIILFDQRGVGASSPQLDCAVVTPPDESRRPDLFARYTAETGLEVTDDNIYYAECVMGLWDQGVELANFTSAAAAADTIDLLRALQQAHGYTAYNLYGISYGTWLGETIARDFPQEPLIRTLILDSLFPRPKSEYIADFYLEKHGMLAHLFAACAVDADCAAAYPNLDARFQTLVAALNASPLTLPNGMALSGDQLVQTMYPFMDRGANWVDVIPYLPKMITDLEQGNPETYLGVQSGLIPPPADDAYTPPDAVYELLAIASCTAVTDQYQRNDLYRQMYNVSIDESREILDTLCTPEEAVRFLPALETLTPQDVNELVKRLYISPIRGTSPTMRTLFNCSETFPFGEDQATIEATLQSAGVYKFLINEATGRIPQAIENCSLWPVTPLPPDQNKPVASQYPTLFISGEWDYVTFPNWAEEAHGRWPNSYYLFVPNGFHSVLGAYGECPTAVTRQFLTNPTTEPDMSCTRTMNIEWVLP